MKNGEEPVFVCVLVFSIFCIRHIDALPTTLKKNEVIVSSMRQKSSGEKNASLKFKKKILKLFKIHKSFKIDINFAKTNPKCHLMDALGIQDI